ncbi:hypothetical protein [Sphingomonas adhaesiva]|uniref:hypothetical protein n=1 Tax=Sphingomonas adhaesiva TaxID=28212 RepID=UPI002FF5FC0C
MALPQRRSSADPRRRRALRPGRLRAVGMEGELRLDGSASPARAMQHQLVHRWEQGVVDDTFGPRYSRATRVTLLMGSATMLWVGLVIAVRLMLG